MDYIDNYRHQEPNNREMSINADTSRCVSDTVIDSKKAISDKASSYPSPDCSNPDAYSDDSDEDDYDNMRGFDPASEDDMEDNGMSRYMENNDEEGWDWVM